MGGNNGQLNRGAVVGLLGFLVFFLGLVGSIGSFLIAAEGGGRWTLFYGAIVWGLVQIIWGFVIAIREQKQQRLIDDQDDVDELLPFHESARQPPPLPEPVRQPSPLPVQVLTGCGVAGGVLLLGLVVLAVVMIVIQSSENNDRNAAKGGLPPPNNELPVAPVAEDLGPKEAQTTIAGATADPTFKDQAPEGGLLIGFKVGLGKAYGVELVQAIQPIYSTPNGEVLGRKFGTNFTKTVSVKAKPGYAVGALKVKAGLVVNGFSVTFMRVKGDALDRSDTYSTKWIGDKTGGNGPTVFGGDGTLIIGIIGRQSASDCNGLGLLKKL